MLFSAMPKAETSPLVGLVAARWRWKGTYRSTLALGLFGSLWHWRLGRRVSGLLLLLDLLLLGLLVRRDIWPEHERSSRLLKCRCLHVEFVG